MPPDYQSSIEHIALATIGPVFIYLGIIVYGYMATAVLVTAIRGRNANNSTNIRQRRKWRALQDSASQVGGISVAPSLLAYFWRSPSRSPEGPQCLGNAPEDFRYYGEDISGLSVFRGGHIRTPDVKAGLLLLEQGRSVFRHIGTGLGGGMWKSHGMPGNGIRAMGRCP